jgi:hypothetical protein
MGYQSKMTKDKRRLESYGNRRDIPPWTNTFQNDVRGRFEDDISEKENRQSNGVLTGGQMQRFGQAENICVSNVGAKRINSLEGVLRIIEKEQTGQFETTYKERQR